MVSKCAVFKTIKCYLMILYHASLIVDVPANLEELVVAASQRDAKSVRIVLED